MNDIHDSQLGYMRVIKDHCSPLADTNHRTAISNILEGQLVLETKAKRITTDGYSLGTLDYTDWCTHPHVDRSAAKAVLEHQTFIIEQAFHKVLLPLKRAQNNLSGLYRLPDDLFIEIASHIPQVQARKFGNTSYRIHDVITGTPVFWTQIALDNAIELIRIVLRRSKGLPLTVEADSSFRFLAPEIPSSRDNLPVHEFMELIPRIGNMRGSIGGLLTHYVNFQSLSIPAPALRSLVLHATIQSGFEPTQFPFPLFDGNTPFLKEVTFQGQYPILTDPLYRNLTSLYISVSPSLPDESRASRNSIASVLRKSPRLERIGLCNLLQSQGIGDGSDNPLPISLPRLRSLHLEQTTGLEILLNLIRPSESGLQHLRLRGTIALSTYSPCPGISYLISTVRTLHFQNNEIESLVLGSPQQDINSNSPLFNFMITIPRAMLGNGGVDDHCFPLDDYISWGNVWKAEFSGSFHDEVFQRVLRKCERLRMLILPVSSTCVQLLERILPSDSERNPYLEEVRLIASSSNISTLVQWVNNRKKLSNCIKRMVLTRCCNDVVPFTETSIRDLRDAVGDGFRFVTGLNWSYAMAKDWSSDRLFDAELFHNH